jgi:hypothetical protein
MPQHRDTADRIVAAVREGHVEAAAPVEVAPAPALRGALAAADALRPAPPPAAPDAFSIRRIIARNATPWKGLRTSQDTLHDLTQHVRAARSAPEFLAAARALPTILGSTGVYRGVRMSTIPVEEGVGASGAGAGGGAGAGVGVADLLLELDESSYSLSTGAQQTLRGQLTAVSKGGGGSMCCWALHTPPCGAPSMSVATTPPHDRLTPRADGRPAPAQSAGLRRLAHRQRGWQQWQHLSGLPERGEVRVGGGGGSTELGVGARNARNATPLTPPPPPLPHGRAQLMGTGKGGASTTTADKAGVLSRAASAVAPTVSITYHKPTLAGRLMPLQLSLRSETERLDSTQGFSNQVRQRPSGGGREQEGVLQCVRGCGTFPPASHPTAHTARRFASWRPR